MRMISRAGSRVARAALGLSAAMALALTACSTSTDAVTSAPESTAASGSEIVIGVDLPLSGPSSSAAEKMRKGFELAAAEINDAGGVNGSRIVLDFQDDAGDPTTGVALVDKFVQNGAVAIVGTYNSPVVLAQSDAVAAAKIPQLAFAVSSAIAEKKNPWVFQTGPTDVGQIDGIVARLKKLGLSRPALLTDTPAFGTTAKPLLEEKLSAAGLTPVLSDTFATDAADLSSVLLKVKQSGADAVVAWTVGTPYATLGKGAQQVGLGLPIFGSASAADPSVPELAGPAADEIYFQSVIDNDKPAVREVAQRWASEFPEGVPSEAFQARDMLTVIVDGVRAVGPDRARLRDYLETYSSSELLSGRVDSVWKYSADNHVGLGGENLVWNVYRAGVVQVVDDGS